jgi:integrase
MLGPKRPQGSRQGLTRSQAEAELRRRMEEALVVSSRSGIALEEAGNRYITHLATVMERKPTTIQDYSIILRRHLVPFFGERPLAKVGPDDVAAYLLLKRRQGLAANTVRNQLNFLHGIFAFAVKRGWASTNPVAQVDRPRSDRRLARRIQFLTATELDELIRTVPDDQLGATERPLYLTAAMSGLRQGELLALRWSDIDWVAGRIRVADSVTRGALGSPKSRRSIRAVPMPDRLARELERHFQRSAFQGDDDLVFCHPQLGAVLDASKLRKRFARALERAGVRRIRFHDLRHTFGTQMAAAGAPLRAIQEWMGHADHSTTSVYAHYAPDPSHGAVFAERAFGSGAPATEADKAESRDSASESLPAQDRRD